MGSLTRASTGFNGLDKVIDSLRLGDNVVWQVDTIDDYHRFVGPFVQSALLENRKVIYMRFAKHEPVINIPDDNIILYELDAYSGFESFSVQVYEITSREGKEAFYVFDCLSDLLPLWAADLMIGNFFVITCPYLFELNTIAYFAILRNSHSFSTIARIRETTQLLVDIYNSDGKYYVHPVKVWNRYSPTMFLPHSMESGDFNPVTSSVDAIRLFAAMPVMALESEKRNLDYWDRLFLDAANLYLRTLQGEEQSPEEQNDILEHLCRLMIGRDERIISLAKSNLTLKDLLDVKSRLIGSGYIGGKAAGMLIARAILMKDAGYDWKHILEPHDSYYIGSDVFYSFIVQNGWWRLRMKQRSSQGYFETASELKEKMFGGVFPDNIKERFQQMLEYFGQSPIIIRSSSLLEDAFGNAFAGKYESVFCVNQGSPSERYRQFEDAIRKVFASTMNKDALAYRLQRGLSNRDEQMAILVQRVSGAYHDRYFFPDLAGVGISYNTYVWKSGMDPKAGMLRLVYGLGTRAVDRVEGDYPRMVALDAPRLRPHAGMEDIRKYSQHDVDVLSIEGNKRDTAPLNDILNDTCNSVSKDASGDIPSKNQDTVIKLIAVSDHETLSMMRKLGIEENTAWVLTFDKLLSETPFAVTMQRMLKTLESIYMYPVDIEFTANFTGDPQPQINLLQCRPLQVKGQQKNITIPEKIQPAKILFKSAGNFMGGSISQPVKRLIYVVPDEYSRLNESRKYETARLIGELNRQIPDREELPVMLAGPGRWGTSTPSLGVPVTFSEINNIAVLVEIAFASAGLMPELSFGTHFFQDLVETDIFYAALFPEKENVILNKDWLSESSGIFKRIFLEKGQYGSVIRVYDLMDMELVLKSDIISQKIICYFS